MLIENNDKILPYYEQIIYVPNRDCNIKYNMYLLYPNRPKSLSKNDSIHIDIYEKNNIKILVKMVYINII